jgi:ABC-type amino acid transport substrate-binding protein
MSNTPQQTHRRIPFIILILICATFLLSSDNFTQADNSEEALSAKESKKMTMVFTRPKYEYYGRWMFLVFDEAFRRIGMELVFENYPPKRSSYMADEGMVDGELGRIYSYNEFHPSLIRVEEHITSIRWVAYTINPELRFGGWSGLQGTDYKVEYRRGLAKAENRLSKLVSAENLSSINSVPQGLEKLASGRTDIYVDVEQTVSQYLVSREFEDSGIRKAGVLEEETLHAFLHKKNEAYAPKLSDALKQMKSEGLFEKYKYIVEEESRAITIE